MIITDISPCKKLRGRVNVYADGEFAFACYTETAMDEGLYQGLEITPGQIARIRAVDGTEYAWRTAVRYTERGDRTEEQVRRKLKERGIDATLIEPTIEKLREYRFVDDVQYAKDCASILYEKYGRWVVRRKLMERGISRELAEEVTESSGRPEVLERYAERAWKSDRSGDPWKRRQKVTRQLSAKGFEFDDIRQVLDACEQSEDT